MTNKQCPKCGTENVNDAVECKNCGLVFDKYENLKKEAKETFERFFKEGKYEQCLKILERIKKDFPDLKEFCDKQQKNVMDMFFSSSMKQLTVLLSKNENEKVITEVKRLKKLIEGNEKIKSRLNDFLIEASLNSISDLLKKRLYNQAINKMENFKKEFNFIKLNNKEAVEKEINKLWGEAYLGIATDKFYSGFYNDARIRFKYLGRNFPEYYNVAVQYLYKIHNRMYSSNNSLIVFFRIIAVLFLVVGIISAVKVGFWAFVLGFVGFVSMIAPAFFYEKIRDIYAELVVLGDEEFISKNPHKL